jgi:hypothetical protein
MNTLLLLLIVILFFLILKKKKEKFDNSEMLEIQRINQIPKDDRTIFVSVASYRDAECPNTINEIFGKSKNASRIFVGICQQNSDTDTDCFNPKYKDNIRIIRFSDEEAKGPTYARYMCSKLYNNENYYMQIDSHTHFEKNWDELLIDMIPSSKVVLSAYPNDWITEKDPVKEISVICKVKYEKDLKMFNSLGGLIRGGDKLTFAPYITGGFFFTYGIFLKKVPFDPDLPHLFWGEEILFTVRMWTHGWDIYCPNKVILYHYYTREEAPKYFENPEYQKYQPLSLNKVRYLLKLEDKYDNSLPIKYKLGKERILEDYYNYIGFDLKNREKDTKYFC